MNIEYENQLIHLNLLQLGEYVSGLTEVHGNVDAQNNINCQSYIAFPKEISDTFGKNFLLKRHGLYSLIT